MRHRRTSYSSLEYKRAVTEVAIYHLSVAAWIIVAIFHRNPDDYIIKVPLLLFIVFISTACLAEVFVDYAYGVFGSVVVPPTHAHLQHEEYIIARHFSLKKTISAGIIATVICGALIAYIPHKVLVSPQFTHCLPVLGFLWVGTFVAINRNCIRVLIANIKIKHIRNQMREFEHSV
jgi:hypothetical protein